MSETVKVQLEIETQVGMGVANTHKQVEELIDGLNWALCDHVEVVDGSPFEVTVWLRTRGERDSDDYAEHFTSHLRTVPWCIVEKVLTAEPVEE